MTETQKVAHLLNRFGLGASESELDYYGQNGVKGAIDRLLNFEQVPDNWTFETTAFANERGIVPLPNLQGFWYSRILTTNRPLQERMTMFWHDHFAVSGVKVTSPPALAQYVDTLRSHAVGKFGDMLEAVSKEPAMLYWLDNQLNVKGKPNENFAREVMELFTLGIGHYTEKDVQEAARAFTGWRFGRRVGGRIRQTPQVARDAEFVFDPFQHDDGEKVILGRSGRFNGDDVLRLLAGESQTARFLVRKLWEWFAYPNPELGLLERLTARFRQTDLDVKDILRAIMESPEFYSAKAQVGVVKDPVVFCVSTCRALGLNQFQLQAVAANAAPDTPAAQRNPPVFFGIMLAQSSRSMGMELLAPPDVAGWEIGQGWISSASIVMRMRWADRIFNPTDRNGRPVGRRAGALAQQDGYYYAILGQPSTHEELVDRLLSIYGIGEIPAPKRQALVKGAADAAPNGVTPEGLRPALLTVSRAIFGMPEFQVA